MKTRNHHTGGIFPTLRRTALSLFMTASMLFVFCPDSDAQVFKNRSQRNNSGNTNKESAETTSVLGRINPRRRQELLKQNEDIARRLDSLERVVEEYEMRIHANDSLAEELTTRLNDNQSLLANGLTEEDYTPDVTDSLLSIWYLHRQTRMNREGEGYDMETERFTSNVPDKVFLQRLSNMNSYITLPYNQTVKNNMILYAEKMPTKMASMLGLAQYYFPIFEETFNRHGLPEELKYMAVIESALNPIAVSRAGAKGMWQFMHTTAKAYGLKINSYVDERLDPVKSAEAAARFLEDSYKIFGDWNLAISSYNCGAGNVNKAIRRAGGNKDFWTIYNYLPKETRGYVPAFVGAMYAFTYYREHGITPEPVALPAHVDTFEIHKMLHFQQISEVVGVPMETLRNLNPQYIHDVIPGTEDTYILRLPYQYTAAFIDNEDSVYVHRAKEIFSPATLENIQSGTTTTTTTSRITYKVKKGDTLGKIASRYHVTINQIKSWNNLRSSNIKIGQRLIIQQRTTTRTPTTTSSSTSSSSQSGTATTAPTPSSTDTTAVKKDTTSAQAADSTSAPSTGASEATEKAAADVKAEIEQADKKAAEQKAAEPEYTVYVVKKGDTLSAIAKRNGLTIKDITSYNNNISTNIKIGQRIKIPRKK